MTNFLQVSDNSSTRAVSDSLNNTTSPITLSGIDTTKFDAVVNGYAVTIWDDVTYPDPSDDPNMEKALVTAASISASGSFTMTRPYAVTHSGTPKIALLVVAQHVKDLQTAVNTLETQEALNTAARHTHANKAVLDATTASYTTAEQTKLSGVAVNANVAVMRSLQSISSNTTAGNAALTDYIYLVSGTTTLTLPTAVGNTNRYTVKNVGVNAVTITGTIDDSASITIQSNVSVDLISDGTNWRVI